MWGSRSGKLRRVANGYKDQSFRLSYKREQVERAKNILFWAGMRNSELKAWNTLSNTRDARYVKCYYYNKTTFKSLKGHTLFIAHFFQNIKIKLEYCS